MNEFNLGWIVIRTIAFFQAGWLWYWANYFAFEEVNLSDRLIMFGLNNIMWILGMGLLWCFLSSIDERLSHERDM